MGVIMHRRGLLLGAAGMASGLLWTPAAAQARTPVVRTSFGPVRGLVQDGINVFKGVRYAAPPVGPLRFKPPEPPKPWTEPVDAIAYGAPAVQMYSRPSGEAQSALGRSLAEVFPTARETREGREDCLFLNVWSRGLGDGKKRPVMVWFHGGGYAYGSGGWPMYEGLGLARKGDVVVVTVNHRLNAFGYAYLAEAMGEAYGKSGNAGLLDLVAVLGWVRDNAEAFGGDPKNVTIFGESGGGAKVSTLMATPAAKGLFHKAIVQSGPGLRGVPKEAAARSADMLLAEIGIAKGDVAALQSAPAEAIIKAAYAAQAKAAAQPGARFGMAPVVDGLVLPRDPFTPDAPQQSADIPLMIGTNKDEMTLFMASEPWFGKLTEAELVDRARQQAGAKADAVLAALRKSHPDDSPTYLLAAFATAMGMLGGSITLAERKAAQKAAPVWMYRLDWETPVGGGVFKSPHTLEIPLVFDRVETNRAFVGPGPEPQAMADQMSAAWLAFARTGNPSTPALPAWPPYDAERRATMMFDLKCQVENDPDAELRRALAA
ncbi:carboxylesterase/lipase family protein [Phenylobacterium sp.]|jgi:para-nitrobenzyl esterase|uniref:carboxylesterase/lipase family protein n=1 Tax=Phenylobacterium sp. TaxID=1871053 RepID=UPI002E3504CA|nr:carboxylesterase/lipase family protein [Phenylobacterium sp.]HEX2560873.1 carboxylesterase/lipase family protein [Phenylobacterium sp.]